MLFAWVGRHPLWMNLHIFVDAIQFNDDDMGQNKHADATPGFIRKKMPFGALAVSSDSLVPRHPRQVVSVPLAKPGKDAKELLLRRPGIRRGVANAVAGVDDID